MSAAKPEPASSATAFAQAVQFDEVVARLSWAVAWGVEMRDPTAGQSRIDHATTQYVGMVDAIIADLAALDSSGALTDIQTFLRSRYLNETAR
jgi:hypothetical protein